MFSASATNWTTREVKAGLLSDWMELGRPKQGTICDKRVEATVSAIS